MKRIIVILLSAALMLSLAACTGEVTDTVTAPETTENVTNNETGEQTGPATTEPETVAPETTGPEESVPETTRPETTGPETTGPETTEGETAESGTAAPETTVPETTAPTTTAPTTTAPTTTAPTTTAPVTTAPVTTAPETTAPVTTAPVTTAPATTAPETEPASSLPDNAYVYEDIYVINPGNYTFKEFSGYPSGLRNGEIEGTCFFNFATMPVLFPMTEDDARTFLDSSAGTIGADYVMSGFKSYEVEGHTVTKLDYIWGNGGAIAQSLVKIHFDDHTIQIQMATLTTIEAGVPEFDAIIDSLGIVK